jgi:branched-chain amino acid transport system ATP-binding protein
MRTDAAGTNADLQGIYALFPVIGQRRQQAAKTLSGGEQQMLAIGRALMASPRLILMDEVSLGLMPRYVDEVFETIKGLHGRGITILLVEQNARKALAVAHRGYVLETGRILLQGGAQALAADPRVKKAYLGGQVRHDRN